MRAERQALSLYCAWRVRQHFENVLESESRQLTFCRPVNSGIQCTQSSWSGCNCSVLMSFGPGDANSQHIRSSAATLQLPAKKPLAVYVVSAGDFRGIFNPAVATICNALRSGSSVPVRLEVAESGRLRPSAAACANSGRRGMGRLPRKCKLRGLCRDPVGTLSVSRTFRRGLRFLANSSKMLTQNSGKF